MGKPTVKVSVTKVTVNKDGSVSKYKKDTDGLKEVLDELGKAKLWNATLELDKKKPEAKRVNGFGYPDVGGHPGHVHGKGWKYNIERGNNTVDRLVVEDVSGTIKKQEHDAKKDVLTAEVEISCKVRVLEDTH